MGKYPKAEIWDIKDEHFEFCCNGLVFDIKHGLVVRLGEDNSVIKAYYGFEEVSKEELVKIYECDPPKCKRFQTMKYRDPNEEICGFMTYFDTPIVLCIMKLLDMKRRGVINKTALNI
jgi:hypothetical protein